MHSQRRPRVPRNELDREYKTNPSSHPVVQPSETFYSPPYTGGFTDITPSLHVTVNESNDGEKTTDSEQNLHENSLV